MLPSQIDHHTKNMTILEQFKFKHYSGFREDTFLIIQWWQPSWVFKQKF